MLTSKAGNVVLCRFNHDHLVADAVRQLVTLRARLLRTIRDEIASWSMAPMHASLFGSAARGDGGTLSDLDLLVVRPRLGVDGRTWDEQLDATGRRLRAATGNTVSWLDPSWEELDRIVAAPEPIVDEWRRDAITVTGPDLEALLRKLT